MHPEPELLNPYEFVRKYRCTTCGAVVMCDCDETLGRRVLPYQLSFAQLYEDGSRVPVTGGFQRNVCRTCRGLPEMPAPKAETHGRTSKIKRYYWRELYRDSVLRFVSWMDEHGIEDFHDALRCNRPVLEQIEADVLQEMKDLHDVAPIYTYDEPSDADILETIAVDVIDFDGTYVTGAGKDRPLLHGGERMSVETYVRKRYEADGYSTLMLESLPFQALFGVLMWMWVQDPADEYGQAVAFGGRPGVPADQRGLIWTILPPDFGTSAHASRRSPALQAHLEWLDELDEGLEMAFDYWIEPSQPLCAYLWAWESEVVDRARTVLKVLGARLVLAILDFLAQAYWDRYLGWPDLLVWNDEGWSLVEVKSSHDKLSSQQKAWLVANDDELHLPIAIAKVHRRHEVEMELAPP